ncbi:MAG: DUF4156 domain-containing protein [Rhodanobacteraceae bacterium]|nr:DUF4156 domain-containing protein [Rhodanobacteraceae bacterium]
MRTVTLAITAALVLLNGCTWVKLDAAGADVRVAYDGRADGCDKAGEISVSVKDRVGFYERNDLKVKDELETLARNQAVSLPADTLVARAAPHNGEQVFDAYRCGRRAAATRDAAPARNDARNNKAEAQTFPVR